MAMVLAETNQSKLTPVGLIDFERHVKDFAREFDMSFSRCLEWISRRTSLEVAAELLGFEVLKSNDRPEDQQRHGDNLLICLADWLDTRGYPVPKLYERGERRFVRSDKRMPMTLTREEYLAHRKTKTRAQIAREQGMTAPGLLHWLGKWGLKDSVVEGRELARLAGGSAAETQTSAQGEAPSETGTKPEAPDEGKEEVPAPGTLEPCGTPQSTGASLTDHPAVRPNLREAHSKLSVTLQLTETIQVAALRAVVADVHQTAIDNGWYDELTPLPVQLALIHSEVLEADRKGEDPDRIAEELADIVLRTFDTAAGQGFDLVGALFRKMYENRHREYRHGGRKY